jgi:hypothetical protein
VASDHKPILQSAIYVLLALTASCFPRHECQYSNGVNVRSPDGKHMAIVEDYVCRPDQWKALSKRALILDFPVSISGKSEEIFSIKGDHRVRTAWLDERSLLIVCSGCDPQMIETRKDKWQDITISYSF